MPKPTKKTAIPPKTLKKPVKSASESVRTKKKTVVATVKGLSTNVYDIDGRAQGTVTLPKEFFGQKPNENLLAQAVRVYFANQSSHKASTKTRAEVRGGGAKPWRQKGTGRARAGSKRSPLWVGGGIVFGPRPKNVQLVLPKKMKKKALISALSSQSLSGHIKIISNFDKLEPKTKLAQNLLNKLDATDKTLVVLENPKENVKLALRNIPNVFTDLAANLNAYKVLAAKNLLISKGAIEKFK